MSRTTHCITRTGVLPDCITRTGVLPDYTTRSGALSAYIGIDLGGTNVRVGAVSPAGELLLCEDALIEARQGPQAGLARIIALIEKVSADADIKIEAIGIGCTGPLDRERGAIQNPYTLPGWEEVDILSPLKEHFVCPAVLENDADAAALGEFWFETRASQKGEKSSLLMVTVGTGVGMGFIQNGRIYRGLGGAHPEGGHIPIDPAGPACYCGARGCLESLASGPAIGLYAQERIGSGSSSLLLKSGNRPETIDAAMVAEAAREGDSLSLEIVERSATYLGLGLVNMLHFFLPDCVIFTGGVMRSFDLFEPRMRQIIKQHSVMSPLAQSPLRVSQLGQQAGIYGAAKAAMQENLVSRKDAKNAKKVKSPLF